MKELQMPTALLSKMGYLSFNFLKDQVNVDNICDLVKEQNMIKEGYTKPYSDVFGKMLSLYPEWSLQAKNISNDFIL